MEQQVLRAGWGGCETEQDPSACLWWVPGTLSLTGQWEAGEWWMLSASQGSLEGGQRHSSSPGLPQLPIRPWARLCFSEPLFPHLNHEEVG